MSNAKEMIRGLQHIGVPSKDIKKTIDFYAEFGFETIWETGRGTDGWVAFLQNGSCVIETYYSADPALQNGAVDHIALDVTDIDAVYAYAKSVGHDAIEGKITFLPFLDNGVKFFTVLGPNAEKVEFNQKL